jgi:membrane associated rhomboid family serine protease
MEQGPQGGRPEDGPALCVACGATGRVGDMFGVPGDYRCGPCAQGVRRRMAARVRTGPTIRATRPVLTVVVLGISVTLFLLHEIVRRGGLPGLVPWLDSLYQDVDVWRGAWWTNVTSTFLHGGLLHIAMNGFALWQIGRIFEMVWGPKVFGAVLLTAGTAGSAISWIVNAPIGTVGLSGGIFGLCTFLWALRRDHAVAAAIATTQFRNSLLAWMGISLVLTYSGTYPISNSGHVTGAVVGWLMGRAHVRFRGRLDLVLGAGLLLAALAAAQFVTFGSFTPLRGKPIPRKVLRAEVLAQDAPAPPAVDAP